MPAMRPRSLLLLTLVVGLLGFVSASRIASPPPVAPEGDEATYTLAALSLWHDRDLAWDERDRARGFALWSEGPRGLALRPGVEEPRFAISPALPLVAAPWAGVLGAGGLRWLNGVLFLAMIAAAGGLVARERAAAEKTSAEKAGSGAATAFWLGSFVASISWLYVARLSPATLLAAGLFLPVAAGLLLRHRSPRPPRAAPPGRRRRGGIALLLLAGASAAAVLHSAPPLALLALPLAVELAVRRRLGGLAAFAGAGLVTVLLLAGLGARWTGSAWSGAGWPGDGGGGMSAAPVRVYSDTFPGDPGTEVATPPPSGSSVEPTAPTAGDPAPPSPAVSRWLREAGWLLSGRYRGLLPWAPFALLAVLLAVARLVTRPHDPLRTSLLAAAVALALAAIFTRAVTPAADGLDLAGDGGLAAVCPVLVLLVPPDVFAGRGRRLAAAGVGAALLAAGLWTLPGIAAGAFGAAASPEAGRAPLAGLAGGPGAFAVLPVELPLLPRLPGFALRPAGVATWVLPRHGFSVEEGHEHGVWMLGGTDAEVFVAAPERLDRIAFTAHSPRPEARLTAATGGDEVLVRFDSEGKRSGVSIVLPAEPAGRDLGYFPKSSQDFIYRLRLAAEGGWVPAHEDPGSSDRRYLSVFLSFDGEGP